MDGNKDVESQVRLIRSVIGRKSLEIDDIIEQASSVPPEQAQNFEDLVDFLKKDIIGYKAITAYLTKGTMDATTELYEIESLPERVVGLYNDFYLPTLMGSDLEEEETAAKMKSAIAKQRAAFRFVDLGKAALENPLVTALLTQHPDILAVIGKYVSADPELYNALSE